MNFLTLFMIALALSLDAFSVSISCGVKLPKNFYRKFLKISIFFAVFQAVMPVFGYLLSNTFLKEHISNYAHYIAGAIFLILAITTLIEYFKKKQSHTDGTPCLCSNYRCLISLAIATSIDAFVIGTVLGIQNQPLLFPVILIGLVTFVNSLAGCLLGNYSISWLKKKAYLISALILTYLAISSILGF